MANIKFSQFTVGNTESDIDFVVGYKGANNIQISPANLLSATLAGYLPLTGGTMAGDIILNDDVRLRAGTGSDFSFFHDGSNSKINNNTGSIVIENFQDDGDIIFRNDDGSGGTATYFFLNGSSASSGSKYTQFPDNSNLTFGSADDLQIKHDGTDSKITNTNGDLYIRSTADDKDIIFQSDDGSGGLTTYFYLDGSDVLTRVSRNFRVSDSIKLQAGSSGDLSIFHNGTNSYLENDTGDLYIRNNFQDRDIVFQSDDGSGGLATYIQIDGSVTTTVFSKNTRYQDNVELRLGSGSDFKAYHSGTNTIFENNNGHIYIKNTAVDKDIIFEGDNGSGGVTEYFRVDGGLVNTVVLKDFRFQDNVKAKFGSSNDLKIFHDGTDSVIQNDTGNLEIQNRQDDGDIVFKSDDGSGGVTEYFRVDGGENRIVYSQDGRHLDNVKSMYGSGADLQIYHDGSNSFINDAGTGDLYVQASDNMYFNTYGSGKRWIRLNENAGVDLFYNDSLKLETTTTGIKITGVSEYADNTAAIAGGLTTGDVYRTGDLLKIVH